IDTKGAYPGKAAEEREQREAIARNLMEMAGVTEPIICIVIGEGGSGGGLELGVGEHILLLENSIYAVISQEEAEALLCKDASLAQKAAERMKITSYDLKELGIIDEIIAEPKGGAHRNLLLQAENIKQVLEQSLNDLRAYSTDELLEKRWEKYKQIGAYEERENEEYRVRG